MCCGREANFWEKEVSVYFENCSKAARAHKLTPRNNKIFI